MIPVALITRVDREFGSIELINRDGERIRITTNEHWHFEENMYLCIESPKARRAGFADAVKRLTAPLCARMFGRP